MHKIFLAEDQYVLQWMAQSWVLQDVANLQTSELRWLSFVLLRKSEVTAVINTAH